MTIIDAALSRSRTVIALLTLILIAGFSAYVNIPKEARPDVNIPIIYVSMSLKGISPEDAERLLVRPMESELKSIEGIKEMRSSAYLGGANVLLEFEAGFNADQALNDVRERADIAEADLPEDAEEPRVEEVNLSLFPIIIVTLGGEVPERTLLKIGRDLQEKVEGISAVLEANIGGDRGEQVEIVIDPLLLDSYGLDPRRVLDAISRSNRLIAAGSLDGAKGSFAVKVPGLLENVSNILDMPLKSNGDSVVTVRDLASVRRTFEDRETYARLNGEPAISLEVKKRTGENIVETVNAVKALVEQERKDWPAAITVTFSGDDSRNIRNMLTDLQNNVLSAVLLVMIIIVAALGVRNRYPGRGRHSGIVPDRYSGTRRIRSYGQHRRAVRSNSVGRPACRRRHSRYRIRRPENDRRGAAHQSIRGGRQADVLADHRVDRDYACRLPSSAVLAGYRRRVYEIPADHADRDAYRFAGDGACIRAHARRPDRQTGRE